MLRWLLRRRIAAFERNHDYAMDYARDLLQASPRALLLFARAAKLAAWRRDVPKDAWYAAKLVAVLREDCGACAQLVVTMAERDGVAQAQLRAVLAGDMRTMTPAVALAVRFAEAVLAHDPRAGALRVEIRQRWGDPALVSLTFAIAGTRLFPTVKYALGHGQSCRRVTVGGDPVTVSRAA